MAVLDTLDTLAPIREKVLAGERLDFDDGVALMETDDLLALGDLADLARRQRGGGDEVYFVQNINLYQTNVCRVKCKFCAFAKTRKQEDDVVREALAGGSLDGALLRVGATDALERSREVALDYARKARGFLAGEPGLEALTHIVIDRER